MTEGRRAWLDRFSRFLVYAAMGAFAIGWAVSGVTKGYGIVGVIGVMIQVILAKNAPPPPQDPD